MRQKSIVGLIMMLAAAQVVVSVSAERKPLQWIDAAKRKTANLTVSLETLDGKPFALADTTGKTLFLNYWATWCKPCKEELPSIGELYRNLHAQGLEVVAFTNEKPETVKKFLKDKDLPFTIVLDPKDTLGKRFNLNIVPSSLVIDASGKIALNYGGEFDWSSPSALEGVRSVIQESVQK